jgi:hypothetical protein
MPFYIRYLLEKDYKAMMDIIIMQGRSFEQVFTFGKKYGFSYEPETRTHSLTFTGKRKGKKKSNFLIYSRIISDLIVSCQLKVVPIEKHLLWPFIKSPMKSLLESGGCLIEPAKYMAKKFENDFQQFV